jgi:hypothetical protein
MPRLNTPPANQSKVASLGRLNIVYRAIYMATTIPEDAPNRKPEYDGLRFIKLMS